VTDGTGAGFDPFNNRLSRDLRNDLSEALLAALEDLNPEPFETTSAEFRHQPDLSPDQSDYLEARLACYRALLEELGPEPDPDRAALLCWNHELFFEFHELLEKRWMKAEGAEKEILQGLIRAAGTYVHRRSGHTAGAAKMAARARETIEKYRDNLPPGFAAEPLLDCLADPGAPPPRFGSLKAKTNHCRHTGVAD